LKQLPKRLKGPIAEWAELPRVQCLDGSLQSVEQLAPFLRDPGGDDPSVGRLSCSPCQVASLEAVEKPSHVRVASRGSFRHRAERRSR
jgi:hypothetical protein